MTFAQTERKSRLSYTILSDEIEQETEVYLWLRVHNQTWEQIRLQKVAMYQTSKEII